MWCEADLLAVLVEVEPQFTGWDPIDRDLRSNHVLCGTQADPLAFVEEVEPRSTDAVVLAEILTLLPHPGALLASLPQLLRPGGIVCIATDYRWQDDITQAVHQLAAPGCGTPGRQLAAAMEGAGFALVTEQELPAAVRQSERCLSLSMHHCTVWRLRTAAGL